MRLTYELLSEPILFTENTVQTLIIENPAELRRVIALLQRECQGERGSFYLSEGNALLPFPASVLFLLNPFELDCNEKKLKSALFRELGASDLFLSESYCRLLENLNQFAQDLSFSGDYELVYNEIVSPETILKLFDFRFDLENFPFAEKILSFLRLQRFYGGKKLFIFLNLKAFFSEQEILLFGQALAYEKIPVLLIEDCQRFPLMPGEKCTVIDKDLCIL